MTDDFAGFKATQKTGWAHFAPLQAVTTIPAARLVKHARIRSGMRVLDVACGTGVVAITAARAGATVTALDFTPELLTTARANARLAGVEIDWHEGDVEQLPFDAEAFDVVVSQYGHMFAPRPGVAVGEMLRVLKPGGTIAFSTWPPDSFVGQMFALLGKYLPPPPPGVAPPPLWGEPSVVRERLGAAVRAIRFDRATTEVPALSVQHYRETSERASGPMVRLVETLSTSDPATLASLRQEFDILVGEYYEDNMIRQHYLMTRATKV